MELFDNSLPSLNSSIRILHSVANAPNIDVYANGIKIISNLAFGKASEYSSISAGSYKIEVFESGTFNAPILTQTIRLAPRSTYTICVSTLDSDLYLMKLKDDDISTSTPQAFLRFINLSPNSPLLTLSLPNDIVLFNSVEYLETTGYYPLSAGIYDFKVLISSAQAISKNIKTISLDNYKFYTIYMIGLFNDKPPLGYLILEDSNILP